MIWIAGIFWILIGIFPLLVDTHRYSGPALRKLRPGILEFSIGAVCGPLFFIWAALQGPEQR